ncbi:iron-siderophore ABC transporter permease [Paenibacillus sp. BIHB 4019]|uniref:Iron-siderophore ABC transporter permease n=1 Tax=Paenibacillus sp. BIHB 4019 TaxID=1870819 RepID=A0A1B2DK72_9BACL|nr:iron ABC transporter permease [Paenibacillus sp. BIHB 4019]ANY68112.1 iron-siderophore ABC transporter permease [Paenibacillus sp. BIHB 4019]
MTNPFRIAAWGTAAAMLLIAMVLSVSLGSTIFSVSMIVDSIFHFDGSRDHIILRNVRFPRTIVTVLAGANLAVAGALMQAITRNVLASPGIFGINSGAAAVAVLLMVIYPQVTSSNLVFAAFVGGACAALIVYAMATAFKQTHMAVHLALTGVAIQAMLSAFTQTIIMFNEIQLDRILFWLAGSVSSRKWEHAAVLLKWSIPALLVAFTLGRSASVLSLGDSLAKGLGQRLALARGLMALIVIVLAGVTVSVTGPIGFVGLIVPHIARQLTGLDYRSVLPLSALCGALLLLLADLLSRYIVFPYETPVGIVTALIGTPFFIYLARRRKKEAKI